MKALSRSYIWWPNMDLAVTKWVSGCKLCQEARPALPRAPVREWEAPRAPWSRLPIDLVGPFQGQNLLIVVDAYSKWLEVILMASTASEAIMRALWKIFATHGLPDLVVFNNGPQFTSAPFEVFLAGQGIRHALTAPLHPSSNGLAERMVRSAKEVLGKMGTGDWHAKIA